MNKKKKSTAGVVCIVVGIILLVLSAGIFTVFNTISNVIIREADNEIDEFRESVENMEKTNGSILETNGGGSDYAYGTNAYTEIEFTDEYGEEYRVVLYAYSSDFENGDKVEVIYDADNPESAMAPDFYYNIFENLTKIFSLVSKLVLGVFGGISALLIIVGIALNVKASKQVEVVSASNYYNNFAASNPGMPMTNYDMNNPQGQNNMNQYGDTNQYMNYNNMN